MKQIITTAVTILFLQPSLLMANSAQMMGNWEDHSMGWFGGMGWISMLFFWGLVILLIIALIKWIMTPKTSSALSALEILKARYAKGEIDKQEFENKKQDLS
jgi:putative membrane protein